VHLNISKDVKLQVNDVVGKCIGILGIRGSGKSNTSAVLCEELLKHKVPIAIADIDGEYWGLKEKYEILVVGKSDNVDIEVDPDVADKVAEVSIERGVPVILDLSGYLREDQDLFLYNFLDKLWDRAGKLRRPYFVILEEAHEFIPQGVRTDLKEIIARIALRGRKRGLGIIVVSQRSAKVDKDVLTQAGILFLHRVVHEADLRVYNELIPWKRSDIQKIVTSLGVGECIYVNGEVVKKIYVRLRETYHAGYTPSIEKTEIPKLKQVSKDIIEAIKTAKEGKVKTKSKIKELEEEIRRLKSVIAEKDKQINELEEIIKTLSYIKIESPKVLEVNQLVVKSMSFPESTNINVKTTIERSDKKLPEQVMRHINRIVNIVRNLSPIERKILSFLVDNYPNEYSVDRLAAWIGYSDKTIRSNPPLRLVEMGLISRRRTVSGYVYRSNLPSFVRKEFEKFTPNIKDDDFKEIENILRDKICDLSSLE